MNAAIIVLGSILRHALTAAGLSAVAVSDDLLTQLASALVTAATIGYSIYRSLKKK